MNNDQKLLAAKEAIRDTCDNLSEFLCGKNESYGNSVFNPSGMFSKASAEERILVRIDDKVSRLSSGSEYPGDDTILDLAGYLILLLAHKKYLSLVNE